MSPPWAITLPNATPPRDRGGAVAADRADESDCDVARRVGVDRGVHHLVADQLHDAPAGVGDEVVGGRLEVEHRAEQLRRRDLLDHARVAAEVDEPDRERHRAEIVGVPPRGT